MRALPGNALRLALGVLLIWIVFRGTAWDEVATAMGSIRALPLFGAIVSIICSQLIRAQRGLYVVRASMPAPWSVIYTSSLIGIFLNVALPFRLGDGARAWVLARALDISKTKSLSMVAVDRIADLVGLLVLMGVVLSLMPPDLAIPAGVLTSDEPLRLSSETVGLIASVGLLLIAGLLIILFLVYAFSERFVDGVGVLIRPLSASVRDNIQATIRELADGLHVLRSPSDMAKTFGFAVLAWGCGALTFRLLMDSFGLSFVWHTPLLMQAMVAVFLIAPLVPGLVGQFHLPIIACLLMTVDGITLPQAKAVALIAHLVSVIPITIMGVAALSIERVALRGLIGQPGDR